ncbi:flagellar protein FlaG [Corallincola platygyrae]|uniref:Flagellar protein FlaG n=1 Tax=Corallincola platygyrae TaxID=1193278 RepID=A0ABW4XJI7_9GAMM
MSVEGIQTASGPQVRNQPEAVNPAQSEATAVQEVKPEEVQAAAKTQEQAQQLKQDQEVERQRLEEMARNLQEFVQSFNKSLSFTVDDASGRDVITVKDKVSGELLRQIPSEEMLKLAVRLSEANGLLLNTEI